ncbi:MAG: mannosyltransferase family protein [Actinomycetota bacterium]|nr:mannosyltransferase family protein [Actinomycetota bacterium]MDH5223387.1 mannosyltransferase family protein [Actinomycetota bacterium]MDH5312541.1 mannosyltransferase family protein [Actinomycetota bacterium]
MSQPAQVDSERTAPVRLRDGVRDSLLTFLGVRIGFSLLGLLATGVIEPRQGVPAVAGWPIAPVTSGWHLLVTAAERQDAAWFLAIAARGYEATDGSAAFFPLYPLLISAVARLPGIGPLGAALIVSNACFAGALVMLHGLSRLEGMSPEAARRTVLFVAIFPTAFFFLAPYTEGPFLLFTISAFWFARRDRWGLAAVAGALAAATRSVGLLLVLALGVEAFLRSREDGRSVMPRLAAALAVGLGPFLYLAWWRVQHGDGLAPWSAQRNWQREPRFPWQTLFDAAGDAWRLGGYWLVDLLVVAVVLIATVAGLRWLRSSYSTYAIASLIVPLVYAWPERPLLSMPRFVAVIFPAFWVLARAAERRRVPEVAVVATFAGGYALLGALFVTWWNVF